MARPELQDLLDRARKLVNSQTADALSLALRARDMAVADGDRYVEAEALNLSAQAMALFGQYGDALETLLCVMELSTKVDIGTQQGMALQLIARSHYTQADYEAATDCWLACIELPRSAVSELDQVQAHIGLGQVLFANEQYENALAHHRRAAELSENCDDVTLMAASLINIAVDQQYLGRFVDALDALKQALPLVRAAKHYEFEAEIYGIIGQIQFARGEVGKARMSLRVALKINRLHNHLWGEANDLLWLGHCSITDGLLEAARDELLRAMQLAEAMGTQNLTARIHLALSTLYMALEQPEQSLAHIAAYQGMQQGMIDAITSSRFASMELRLND